MNFQHTIAERSSTPQPQTRGHVFPEHFCLNAFLDAVNATELDSALSGGGTDSSTTTRSSTHPSPDRHPDRPLEIAQATQGKSPFR